MYRSYICIRHIYIRQRPVINAMCEFADKMLIFAVLTRWLLQHRETVDSGVVTYK